MEKDNQARVLISGGFLDFLTYLSDIENPMIVGRGYPKTRLLESFHKWAQDRNFYTSDANVKLWRHACSEGLLSNGNKK
jgi:hypothetical protein